MAYCVNCGERLQDGVKFCAGCGAFVEYQQSENSKRKAVYDGELHKCPNCGETLNSFVVNCPSCGYELRGTKSANAVQELAHKLDLIESQREYEKPVGVFKQQARDQQISKTDERKISLIKNFAIPNTKEDLMEFFILASSNINLERYNEQVFLSASQKAVSDAWVSKFEQAYEKAKLSFGYTQEFVKIKEIYEKRSAQIATAKKKGNLSWVQCTILTFSCLGFLLLIAFVIFSIDANNIDKENQRLEDIVFEVYEAIDDENYTLARAKSANIVFSGSTTMAGEQAVEKWDKTRTELLDIIDSAEKSTNNKNDVSKENIDTPTDEPTKSQDMPPKDDLEVEKSTECLSSNNIDNSTEKPTKHQEQSSTDTMNIENTEETSEFSNFTYGYEKAEFDKYNSYATENGLADTKIYIECTINEIEILEADGTESIIGYVTDEEGNHWLVHMHVVPIVSETYFDKYIGKRVVMKGVYSGFSGKMQMPAMFLDEMLVVSDDTVINGIQKLLE